MGFGVVLASDGVLLGDDLLHCLAEVRVEQSLDEPAAFALRFLDDIREDELTLSSRSELKPGRVISIALEGAAGAECLVTGPVEGVKSQMTLGGPGSWFEVRGHDRRVELSRSCQQRSSEGRASDVVSQILQSAGFTPDVTETTKLYSEEGGTLNQRATDLEFVSKLARQNNLSFWISYECTVSGTSLNVVETAHVKASPDRPGNGEGGLASVSETLLSPTVSLEIRVNVSEDKCPTVSQFELEMDVDRPTSVQAESVNAQDGGEDAVSPADPQPAIESGGQSLQDVTDASRCMCITSAGDADEAQSRAEAALTDAGWFINAKASTTSFMLGGFLRPHDVLNVTGLDSETNGAYQVKSVTHVINAADHYMDFELRRNAVGGA